MRLKIVLFGLMILALAAGTANALNPAGQVQTLLDATTIAKFADPLPVAGDIAVVDATKSAFGTTGAGYTSDKLNPFPIVAREFLAQVVPQGTCVASTVNAYNSASWTWGYRTPFDWDDSNPNEATVVRNSYLGPVVVAERGVAFFPSYGNALPLGQDSQVLANLPIDMTLDWANPLDFDCGGAYNATIGGIEWDNLQCGGLDLNGNTIPPYQGPIPIATHLHGGEVAPAFDGGPDAWFTQDGPGQKTGAGFPGAVYEYYNDQQESTIWFHDHALGITRLNVYAGLAGVYPIIDPVNPPLVDMPAFPAYDIPLILQDRSFDTNCQKFYNLASNPQPNPTVHPFWIPEFIGDTIVVNGKTWPFLDVEPRQYRFRFVNGANARFFDLTLHEQIMGKGGKGNIKTKGAIAAPMTVIAADDGYLLSAVATSNLIIGPGERYEVIVDFTALAGKNVVMENSARTPFPGGAAPVKGLTDTVMQFRVNLALAGTDVAPITNGTLIRSTPIEPILNAHNPATGSITRQLTLNEVIGPGGPLELVVNNSKFNLAGNVDAPTVFPGQRETELPAVGDTEIWEIINITADAHPMHTHLVSFQILDRTAFRANTWITQYDALLLGGGILPGHGPPNAYNVPNADGAIGGNPAISPFLQLDTILPPLPYEQTWKDVVITYPGEVTRVAVRWAPTDVVPELDVNGLPVGLGVDQYPNFNATDLQGGVGYVWHCHIIDHEDNEMMRNYLVGTSRQL